MVAVPYAGRLDKFISDAAAELTAAFFTRSEPSENPEKQTQETKGGLIEAILPLGAEHATPATGTHVFASLDIPKGLIHAQGHEVDMIHHGQLSAGHAVNQEHQVKQQAKMEYT